MVAKAAFRVGTKTFRSVLVLTLLALFLWQTFMSASKYLQFGITVNIDVSYPEEQVFPSITLCPVFARSGNFSGNGGKTMVYNGTVFTTFYAPGFIYGFQHGNGNNKKVLKVDVENSSEWTTVERFDSDLGEFLLCYTYDPSTLYSGGMDSLVSHKLLFYILDLVADKFGLFLLQLLLYLNTSHLHSILMFVHEADQNVLVPTPLYGSDFIYLNMPGFSQMNPRDHFLQYRYVSAPTIADQQLPSLAIR